MRLHAGHTLAFRASVWFRTRTCTRIYVLAFGHALAVGDTLTFGHVLAFVKCSLCDTLTFGHVLAFVKCSLCEVLVLGSDRLR